MTRPIRWLHLSDLHHDCPGKELWEQVKIEFLRDLDVHLDRLGAPDLLIFTGDLAYSGAEREYEQVDALLDELRDHFTCSGAAEPLLAAVPGNHDLAWPRGRASREYRILRSFDGTIDDAEVAEIYEELWHRQDASFIADLFPGYRPWFERRVRRQLEARAKRVHFSHFPCDFTAVVEPAGAFPLTLVGLNSTWLQYADDDFAGRLLVPLEQLRAALAPAGARNPYSVFDNGEPALLLLHQPPEWLSPKGRDIFDESIYQPSRFTACLFGHLHGANGTLFQTGGGKPRVFLQAPSLCGLEHWGRQREDRAFGYTWGQLTVDGELRLWPRKLERRHDGASSFGHDPGFHEDPDGVLLRPGKRSRSTVAVAQRGADLRRYLARLIERTETLEIRGVAGERSHTALAPPIENLYTPLRMRGAGERFAEPGGDLREVGAEALQAVLRQSDRVLIEGEPGAGKTTFLRLVACMLARDADGRPCPGQPSWSEGHLGLKLDKPRVPILLRLGALVALLADRPEPDDRGRLVDLLAADWRAEEIAGDFDREYWQRLLEEGGAWVLLDGLDEVADRELRSRVFAIARDAIAAWQAPMVVASRPFQTEKLVEMGFRVATVEPFRDEEIEAFLAYWTAAVHRQDPRRAREGRSGRYLERVQSAILTRPKVRALARNPVMLTCLCVVHWNRGDLPDVRSRVYDAVIHWLLNARADVRRERFGLEPELAERALSLLALDTMSTAAGKQSILEMSAAVDAVAPAFERYFQEDDAEALAARIREWLLFECEGSGVVEELAGGRLRFWHLTFQEYLAALELARGEREQWWPVLSERLDQAQWWETTELFATCLYDLGQPESVDGLLKPLLEIGAARDPATEARMVGIVGRLLQPLKVCGYRPASDLQSVYSAALERTMAIFEPQGAARVPAADRIAAAEALGRGGDPRLHPDVDNFLAVPGTGIDLGKYPVTVAEYQRFVDARGYEEERWWQGGWPVTEEREWDSPGSWEEQLSTPNRPVVEVSWWEAMAYCRWLSDQRGLEIRLPTESEWETAATHPDGGEYPWGKAEPDQELANFGGNVGRPTPVGVYPAGVGAHGHLDLGGNVLEWCLDELAEGKARPLRGGAWWLVASSLRSADRVWFEPGVRYVSVGFRLSCSASSTVP